MSAIRSCRQAVTGLGCSWPFLLAVLTVLAMDLELPVHAQEDGRLPEAARRAIAEALAAKTGREPAQKKVDSLLLELSGAERPTGVVAPASTRTGNPPQEGERALGDLVEVDIRADVTAEVLAQVRSLGGTIVNNVPKYRAIRAQLPPSALESLAELDSVQFIRSAVGAVTWADVATAQVNASEGDRAHRADVARREYSVNGAGIGIGVISNGVDSLADRQSEGDLPGFVTVLPGMAGVGDEGTAMLEIVHDLAPGAELFFSTALHSPAQYAENIEALCEAGAHVIVDDIYYPNEAVFQDDVVAQGINAAVAAGCFYFSAAGNAGNLNDGTSGTWEGDYVEGDEVRDESGNPLGIAHEFTPDKAWNAITRSSPIAFVLQWSDALGASANDYDLFVFDESMSQLLASSTNTQDGIQDPIELIQAPFGNQVGSRLVVVKASGAADRYLRLSAIRGELETATAGNTFGHSAAENAVAVAAVHVDVGDSDGGFDGTESVAYYSSDGPRWIFFEPDGAAITPGNFGASGGRRLGKPDLAAASCVSTATPDYRRFCGTSAAAPHAAALAALVLESAGGPGNLSREKLRAAMTASALDIEAPGVDRDSGAGIVMAPVAVEAVYLPEGDRNQTPIVVAPLADLALSPVGTSSTLDVAGVFVDPDDDPLTYAVWSSEPRSGAGNGERVAGHAEIVRPWQREGVRPSARHQRRECRGLLPCDGGPGGLARLRRR